VCCYSVRLYTCLFSALLQSAMKDDWLNLGFLGDELKPYVEPIELIDEKRIGNYFVTIRRICYYYWVELLLQLKRFLHIFAARSM